MRRQLGKRIQEPIEILAESRHVDSITFVETDNEAAKPDLAQARALQFRVEKTQLFFVAPPAAS